MEFRHKCSPSEEEPLEKSYAAAQGFGNSQKLGDRGRGALKDEIDLGATRPGAIEEGTLVQDLKHWPCSIKENQYVSVVNARLTGHSGRHCVLQCVVKNEGQSWREVPREQLTSRDERDSGSQSGGGVQMTRWLAIDGVPSLRRDQGRRFEELKRRGEEGGKKKKFGICGRGALLRHPKARGPRRVRPLAHDSNRAGACIYRRQKYMRYFPRPLTAGGRWCNVTESHVTMLFSPTQTGEPPGKLEDHSPDTMPE
ncbi:hypothetical protein CIRG_06675 [Coccidioides immitis RMSCC 2394]|uniref:Uncharacterized protein n=1 Tax=Coccidioides immitis RMSCC 2394 TaxID=404692 RepID=A0A0J6YJ95_COCIT|nr:hypothetical protein CIRG_06675 [Coccidioides immitis RMSCC 2394]